MRKPDADRERAASAAPGRGEGGALQMLQAIWALAHGLQVRSRRMSRDLGVTGPQRLVIRLVATGQDTSPGELADRLVLHKSTVTGILARLERRRLLARRPDAADRRRVTLSVTAAGERLARPHPVTIESVVEHEIGKTGRLGWEAARALMASLAEALAGADPAVAAGRRGRRGHRPGARADAPRPRR